MKLTPRPTDLTTLKIGTSAGVRAPGLHASDVYNDFYQDAEPTRYKRGSLPAPLLLETGLTIETMLEEGMARRLAASGEPGSIERPIELTYTGTFKGRKVEFAYNPDLIIYNGVGPRIGEIKATWMSSKIPHAWTDDPAQFLHHASDIRDRLTDPKFDKYYSQVKIYDKALQTYLNRFFIWFIAGDYSRPYRSQFVEFDVEFTPREIEEEWDILLRHAISKGLI